mmetsp:Transcript_19315/g.42647  ORF Transcript_19315/g.42647 Transcript_19315/m.42647 type:complete len:213 (-) Transcript_19315:62-700(-)
MPREAHRGHASLHGARDRAGSGQEAERRGGRLRPGAADLLRVQWAEALRGVQEPGSARASAQGLDAHARLGPEHLAHVEAAALRGELHGRRAERSPERAGGALGRGAAASRPGGRGRRRLAHADAAAEARLGPEAPRGDEHPGAHPGGLAGGAGGGSGPKRESQLGGPGALGRGREEGDRVWRGGRGLDQPDRWRRAPEGDQLVGHPAVPGT